MRSAKTTLTVIWPSWSGKMLVNGIPMFVESGAKRVSHSKAATVCPGASLHGAINSIYGKKKPHNALKWWWVSKRKLGTSCKVDVTTKTVRIDLTLAALWPLAKPFCSSSIPELYKNVNCRKEANKVKGHWKMGTMLSKGESVQYVELLVSEEHKMTLTFAASQYLL